MEENYLISIRGRQMVNDQTSEIEVTAFGSYIKKNGKRFITYKEYDKDTNHSQTSVLKVEDSRCITLMRGGMDGTRLILENGKRHMCQYSTEYGQMMLGVYTSNVDNQLTDEGGRLIVNYTLDLNANLSSVNQIYITVKEVDHKNVKIRTAGKGPAAAGNPVSHSQSAGSAGAACQ
ncbi:MULTISPECIES: DUF1934 domain-containing protein [Caproicibacterium]|jgi:uncharacterized beta-barrel protein YwiB (DUF1934 family)|uniref:DUF1934 family protein n=1 Tax=Caproicibacterium lactatifermentans TaxID=2666138 RepID=A0A859DR70_9FIRM|nr:DUF1934 domain-containing protein [Caproicibacterium lactatifermentans]ARP50991.1 hypothetical protein B6259_08980 [Ruminococcaceae bacterium CPB6]MDD4807094.1 DUF1934 domain-containing protein [Oscillospiraceae bacterium]QKN23282.1 DUF1934 family protein [Caproicibacterium lactatifermentans]QKO30036.1 DUF1934 family protein [Caproicibacterium lactatifermentans]